MGLSTRQYAAFIGLAILIVTAFLAFSYREDPRDGGGPGDPAPGEADADRPDRGEPGPGGANAAGRDAGRDAVNRDPIGVEATEEGSVPLEGARVGLWPEGDTELGHWDALSRAVSDVDGRATLPPTGASPPFVLAIDPPRERPDLLRLVVRGWRPGDPVPPVPGSLAVSGIVFDPNGRPVEGASVLCAADGYDGVGPITDAGGNFRIDGLLEGPVTLTAVPAAWSLTPAAGEPVQVRAGDDDVRLLLRPDCELSARISPWLAGMYMSARLWTQDQPEIKTQWRVQFARDGSFRVPGLRPQHRYSLLLQVGFLDRCPLVTDISPDSTNQVFELARGLEIRGSHDAPPDPERLVIRAWREGEGLRPQFSVYGRPAEGSRFLIPGLFAGTWTVTGSALYRKGEGYFEREARAVVEAGSSINLVFKDPAEIEKERERERARSRAERERVKVR